MKKINKMNKMNKVNKDIIKLANGTMLSRKKLLEAKRDSEVELKFGYDEKGEIICLNPEDCQFSFQMQRDFNKFAKEEYFKSKGIPVPTYEYKFKPQPYTCCICGEVHTDFGNNPAPAMNHGRCCDFCNSFVVMQVRMENVG